MTVDFITSALAPLVWPLVILLLALLVLRQVREDVRPIFSGIVLGLSKNAQNNATAYAIALGFGLSASFSAFWDVFHALGREEFQDMSWHQYAALWTKVANPFIVAVLAYATQNKFTVGGKPSSPVTAAPFPPENKKPEQP